MKPVFIEIRASLLLDALCEVIGSDVEGESDGQGESDGPIDGRVSPDAVPILTRSRCFGQSRRFQDRHDGQGSTCFSVWSARIENILECISKRRLTIEQR